VRNLESGVQCGPRLTPAEPRHFRMSVLSRRSFLNQFKFFWAPSMVAGAGSYEYGAELERHQISVERHVIALPLGEQGPPALRVVSLTDFHYDPLHEVEFFQKCVKRTNELDPDVVLLTGDFVTHSCKRVEELTEVLAGLKPRHGLYACLGNHDHWNTSPQRILECLDKAGIDLLRNQHSRIHVNGGEVIFVGLDSIWSGNPMWDSAARGLKKDDRTIVLMHEPDYADTVKLDPRAVFQLSGHTHGGQVRLPLFGALRLPTYGRRYQEGFYDVGKMKLYVNRGLGTIGIHVRFLCPPEIACFDICNADHRA